MKLLLIGSGELGSRFLQASINTNLLHEITVIEPNEESVILSKNRISELPGKTISIIWLKNISDLKDDNFNLCIIATQAENRIDILLSIANAFWLDLVHKEIDIFESHFLQNVLSSISTHSSFDEQHFEQRPFIVPLRTLSSDISDS